MERSQEQVVSRASSRDIAPETLKLQETRPRRRYVISRPRALQFSYRSQILTVGGGDEGAQEGTDRETLEHSESAISNHSIPREPSLHDGIEKQRERMDLFIDLIWVGIIGNISEVYSSVAFSADDSRIAYASLLLFLVFPPSWRIWNGLREFLNNYYMDDILQRFFIFWILVLSLFYGNNLAYLPEDTERVKIILISVYLLIRTSLVLIEAVYSIFIPWLRRLTLFTFVCFMPSVGLWIGGIYTPGPKAIGPMFAATILDYLVPLVIDSPLGRKATRSEYRKALDPHHFISRMASFFIIVLGEGVLQLIKDGPLGIGLTITGGYSVWSLIIYFLLAYIYFNKDSSGTFVSAVVKRGWRTNIWIFWHIPMFMGSLTLSAGIMFIIRHTTEKLDTGTNPETISQDQLPYYLHKAVWTVSTSLAIILFSMTGLAILDESMDPPGTLRVNNRYVRLSGRLVYILIVLLIPIHKKIKTDAFMGTCAILLMLLSLWEWVVATEKVGGIVEPAGLIAMARNTRVNDGVLSMIPSGSHNVEKRRGDTCAI